MILGENGQRVVAGRDFTASVDFGVEEDELPVGLVTFTLTDTLGAVLVVPAPATPATPGVFTFDVAAEFVPQVDFLTASWSGSTGTVMTTIDVRERRLFTLPRLIEAFPEVGAKSTAILEQERAAAEDFLELGAGRGLVRQFGIQSFLAEMRRTRVKMAFYPVLAVRYLIVGGIAATDLTPIVLGPTGLSYPNGLDQAVTIGFEHGQPAADATRVAMILARHRIVNGPLDSRATGLPVEGGGVIPLLTPGVKGSVTGIPEVDQFLGSFVGRGRSLV